MFFELLLTIGVALVIFDVIVDIGKVIRNVREFREKELLAEAKKTEGSYKPPSEKE